MRQKTNALRDRWAQGGRQRAVWPLAIVALLWAVGLAFWLRLDVALVDFLGHAKDLSLVHGAVGDSPVSFVTPEGTPIDKLSLQDLHDEDTSLLHGARDHLMFVLGCIFSLPIAVSGLLLLSPKGRAKPRKPRVR